jgi:hypothetical protein
MKLQETMSDMLHRDLTIEEARVLADEQFGMLATYLREQYEADKAIITWQIEDVQGLDDSLSDQAALTILKNFENHHEGSMESMWLDLQYHIDEFKRGE